MRSERNTSPTDAKDSPTVAISLAKHGILMSRIVVFFHLFVHGHSLMRPRSCSRHETRGVLSHGLDTRTGPESTRQVGHRDVGPDRSRSATFGGAKTIGGDHAQRGATFGENPLQARNESVFLFWGDKVRMNFWFLQRTCSVLKGPCSFSSG